MKDKAKMWFLSLAVVADVLMVGSAELFPFVISYDAKENAANVSKFVEKPAGKHGFVRAEGGRFVTDAGPIRFHATNFTGPANFPSHADADAVAARLARLGVNCVRMHFMDTWYVNFMPRTQGILADDAQTQRKLDPGQLDKLDYLLAALKRNGVYANLNLHVGRTLDARDGLPDGGPWANKCVGQFMPRMIELQKEYASDLLSHVNPYTGNAWKDEPALAMIEISNEDSLMHPWLSGGFFGFPKAYQDELARQWNAWLRKRYATPDELRAAWSVRPEPFGAELVRGGGFDVPAASFSKDGWWTEPGSAKVEYRADRGTLKVKVEKAGREYEPKLFHSFPLKKGQVYTLSVKLRRLRGPDDMHVSCAVATRARGGWSCLGFQELFRLTRDWQIFQRAFVATEDEPRAFVQFTRFPVGLVEMDDLSVRSGAEEETLDVAEGFEAGTVPLPRPGSCTAIRRDMLRFLTDVETAYWTGIRRHVKEVVGAKQPVSGTQLDYSAQTVQAQLDYVDHHAYWRHPSGPEPAGWIVRSSKQPWSVGSDAMVHTLGNALRLSAQRVKGKPYTVSEYNHPYPNAYGAEGQLILAAFAAYQDWSGIFQYSYNHYPQCWAPKGNPWCIFDSIARTDVLAHFPACSALFLRGDVAAADPAAGAWLEATAESVLAHQVAGKGVAVAYEPMTDALVRAVGVSVDGASASTPAPTAAPGPFIWNREVKGKAYFAVDTVNTKVFTGFPEGREVKLGSVRLAIGKTSLDWATVSLLSRDATGFGEKGAASILVAATAACGNADRVEKTVDARHVTLPEHGEGPVVTEGVPFTLTLPAAAERVSCWALGPDGSRGVSVPVADVGGNARIAFGPQYRTVWYEIAVR